MIIKEVEARIIFIKYTIKKMLRKGYLFRLSHKSEQELINMNAKLYEKYQGKSVTEGGGISYTQKMQWAKMCDNDSRKVYCTDKLRVRKYVSQKIGEDYLIPLIGVWGKVDDIEWENLPEEFVLKTNCSCGDAIIIKNKSELSRAEIRSYKQKLDYYMHMKYGYSTYELHYNDIKPMILAEQFIDCGLDEDLQDYKFLCFGGKSYFCWVDIDRFHNHKRNIYDMNWELQNWTQGYANSDWPINKPENFEEMVTISEKLASGFSHVRVDLYNVKGRIFFGEMTFTSCSGLKRIVPDSADMMLGSLWEINTDN